MIVGGVFTADTIDANDFGAFKINANRELSVTIENIPAVTQSGTWNITDISGTISLPTGASTSVNQALLLGTKVDSNEGDNLRVSNVNQEQFMSDMLKELKKINLHLSFLNDITIQNTEVE